jgi:hypothetical protein
MDDRKKVAAAVSAVLHYIRTEEEAFAMQATVPAAERLWPGSMFSPAMPFKPWGISGRQAQMQMRNLMQMRTFRRVG